MGHFTSRKCNVISSSGSERITCTATLMLCAAACLTGPNPALAFIARGTSRKIASFSSKMNPKSSGPFAFSSPHPILDKTSPLLMSSLGHDGDKDKPKPFNWRDYLPPAPEDQLVMSGDVAALFVYSFLDHTLNDLYVSALNDPAANSAAALAASIDSTDSIHVAAAALPVWFDPIHSAFGPILSAALPLSSITYAPAISTAGTSSVLVTSCWLLSGYLTGAFLFKNTLGCSTSRALYVTGKTWLMAATLMVLLALGSDAALGWCDCLKTPSLGGLTKADADYIFDSLSVLITWRFVVSWMLGYGKD